MYINLDKSYKLAENLIVRFDNPYLPASIFTGLLDGDEKQLEIYTTQADTSTLLLDIGNLNKIFNGGLFSINRGEIKNLNIYNLSISTFNPQTKLRYNNKGSVKIYNGGLVGKNEGTIDNITFTDGSYISDRNNSAFGIIAGMNTGSITNCRVISTNMNGTSKAIIYSTGDTGGIVGRNVSGGVVSDSSFQGLIQLYIAEDDGGQSLRSWGGIAGYNTSGSILSNVYANVRFEYYGESSRYHNTPLGLHNNCNLQIRVGSIIGHQNQKSQLINGSHGSGSTKITFIGGNFHNGTHEKKYLFSYSNGQIGRDD